jgi:hypothetical protein
MKKIILVLLILIPYFAYSQENDTDITHNKESGSSFYDYTFKPYELRIVGDIGYRYIFPIKIEPYNLSFVNFGLGVGTDLIKYVLSPGIYLDIGIGTDWFYIFSDSKKRDSNYSPVQFLLSGEVRLYNYMRIYQFDVIPFLGCNFLLFYIPLPNVGVSIALGSIPIGIEYAYYFPKHFMEHKNGHHIMIKITATVN